MTSLGNQSSNTRKSQAARATISSVIRLERRVWKAAQCRDADTFAKLVPSDAVMVFQSGVVSQAEYLASMPKRTISRYELRNIRGFMPNARTVILLYEAVRLGDEAGKTFPEGTVIESTIWIKRGRSWVAVLNQETPIHGSQTSHSS